MSTTRRTFIKEAAVAGAATAVCGIAAAPDTEAQAVETPAAVEKCPFFDQPLRCGGKKPDGGWPCDS
jgi:hypothetical protein